MKNKFLLSILSIFIFSLVLNAVPIVNEKTLDKVLSGIDRKTALELKLQHKMGNVSIEEIKSKVSENTLLNSYTNKKLGAILTQNKTVFRLFSPRATKVILNLKKTKKQRAATYEMKKSNDGVWEKSFNQNMEGFLYKYSIDGPTGPGECFDPKILISDPYSKAVTSHNGYSIVVNTNNYNWTDVSFKAPAFKDLVIYEMHVKDYTKDSSSKVSASKKGTYLGLLDGASKNLPLRHLQNLGVNAVEILPLQEFDNNAAPPGHINHWGYMTSHFFAPETSYSSKNINNPVKELKTLINTLHNKNIAVIMDVVFNHTCEGNEEGPNYSFKGVDNKLYYRLTPSYYYWNGTGCGNEFKSESPMVRKYIVDCLKYWVNDYHIDGFRFDLAAGIDKTTILEIAKQLPKRIYLIAEPWTADWNRKMWKKGDLRGSKWTSWNDDFKNTIRGYIVGKKSKNDAMTAICGSCMWWTGTPLETVNFVECHDNNTIADLYNNNPVLQKLAGFMVLTSQGIPMLHQGQEFMKNKHGNSNSYDQDNKINWIDWNLLKKKDNKDVNNFYSGLIAIRKKYSNFKRTKPLSNSTIEWINPINNSNLAIGYRLKPISSREKNIIVLINPESYKVGFKLPSGEWNILCNGNNASLKGFGSATKDYWVESKTGVILVKK